MEEYFQFKLWAEIIGSIMGLVIFTLYSIWWYKERKRRK